MNSSLPIKHALISCFDKTDLEGLCLTLKELGAKIYSTGGTAKYLTDRGFSIISIESVTQFPEMMDGRLKTIHPLIFGGILARRNESADLTEIENHHMPPFDLVVVNLYPFWDHLEDSHEVQAKYVDIGGPSMLRAAAKNAVSVTVLSSPDYYAEFTKQIQDFGGTHLDFRYAMAAATFQRTAQYDGMIAEAWVRSSSTLPTTVSLGKLTPLRYGENPHQEAAWGAKIKKWNLLQGKELSYNNLLDADSAVRLNHEFFEPSITIVKHNNPCGVAAGPLPLADLFTRALQCDPKSAFGGIVSANREIDSGCAELMSKLFLEVIIAPSFSEDALKVFSTKKNLRLIQWAHQKLNSFEVRSSLGGWLIQTLDDEGVPKELKVVTPPNGTLSHELKADLIFAWLVAKHVRSNAIVIAKDGQTLGVGAGQMSRIDAVQIALEKAKGKTRGAVLASDAFFPFRDNIDTLKDSGISAIIQPGGSQRDIEVIQACEQYGITLVFTGTRHFRH